MEFFRRIFKHPLWAAEIIIATVLANILVLATPLYVTQVLNRYIPYGVGSTLLTLTIGVLVAILFEFFFRLYRIWVGNRMTKPFDFDLSVLAFQLLTTTKFQEIDRLPIGMRQHIMNDAEIIRRTYSSNNLGALLDIPFVILFLIVVLFISFWVFVIGLIATLCLLVIGLVGYFLHRGSDRHTIEVQMAKTSVSNVVINQPLMIRMFSAVVFLLNRWQKIVMAFLTLQIRTEHRQQLIQYLNQTVMAIATVFVLCIGAILVVLGHLTVGGLIGANILISRGLMPIVRFVNMIPLIMDANRAQKRLNEAKKMPMDANTGNLLKTFSGRVECRDVSFGFLSSPSPLFESLNVAMHPRQLIVITGPNSSGKTTLAKVLVGLLEPQRGQVLVDGIELRQLAVDWWRHQITFLPQDMVFLDATIKENILVANQTASTEMLNEVIRRSDLSGYLDKNRLGIEELLEAGGQNLSAGVKRRIGLARALMTQGKLIVLDEPVEGLDPEGVQAIYHLIAEMLQKNHTIIVVTYDQKIITEANIVIDLGIKPTPSVRIINKDLPNEPA